jgi:hypothetical protein
MTDPCTPLEERAAIIAEACGVSQAEGLRMAKEQAALFGTTRPGPVYEDTWDLFAEQERRQREQG